MRLRRFSNRRPESMTLYSLRVWDGFDTFEYISAGESEDEAKLNFKKLYVSAHPGASVPEVKAISHLFLTEAEGLRRENELL